MNNPITEPGYYWIQTTMQGETFTELIVVKYDYKKEFIFLTWPEYQIKYPNSSLKDYSAYFKDSLILVATIPENELNYKPLNSYWIDRWQKIEEPKDPEWTCNYR